MSGPSSRRSVPVQLGARSYDILIGRGLITSAGTQIAERFAGARAVVVTDANVAGHHGKALCASLRAAGLLLADPIVVAAGEGSKSFATLETVCRGLLQTGLERRDLVVALGGGVIGDLAAFAASIVRRGVRLVQIPTSLLAQVDSSVGGKTGINTPEGKNLIGTFHQPSLVLADLGALETLPPRQMRAGYAEVAKYGLLGDAKFFAALEKQSAGILDGTDPAARAAAIETCCRMKAGIVARDETETGERALLNLGHTFGHALEAACGFSDKLLHGEAVSIGMVLAYRFSEGRGLCAPQTAGRAELHLRGCGLPTRIADVAALAGTSTDELVTLMHQDKKVSSGEPTLILARSIGEAFISRQQTWDEIATFLAANRD
jgi:3-dehydroquinate synthase